MSDQRPTRGNRWTNSSDIEARIEATRVAALESCSVVEIQLGHYCNDRCVFCVSGLATEQGDAAPVAAAPIVAALEDAAAQGIRRVTFLGGEPTIQRSFEVALARAVALGFEEIVIFTNGARGLDTRWMDRICALGTFTWRVSIQGATEDAHEAATLRKRSWRRVIGALEYLSERGADITANICVCTQNFTSLPGFPALLKRYGVRQFHVDMVRPPSAGIRSDAHFAAMIPSLTGLGPFVRTMLEGFARDAPEIDVSVGNLPFCVLPDWAHRIHHGGTPTLTYVNGHPYDDDEIQRKYDVQALDAVYGATCESCVFRRACRGVPHKYAELYGTDELQPVSAAALSAQDPEQRSFATTMGSFMAPLSGCEPPAPWVFDALLGHVRDRRVELRYVHPDGALLRLWLLPVVEPPADAPPAQWSGREYRAAVVCDAASARAAKPLLAWLRTQLDQLDHRRRFAAVVHDAVLPAGFRLAAAARVTTTWTLTFENEDGHTLDVALSLRSSARTMAVEATPGAGLSSATARRLWSALHELLVTSRPQGIFKTTAGGDQGRSNRPRS